jgi:hypothetical protein
MPGRPPYRATKEGERRIPSPAGFSVRLAARPRRAPVEGRPWTCTSTLALRASTGREAVEGGIFEASPRVRRPVRVNLSARVQGFQTVIGGGGKDSSLNRRLRPFAGAYRATKEGSSVFGGFPE